MLRLVLVDDHAVVRAGLRLILQTQPDLEIVGEASSGENAVPLVAEVQPDLVVVDLAMGDGIGGIETTRRLRALSPAPQVLIFTTYDTDADIVRAVDAGAVGYVLKTSSPEEIFRAVRTAAMGQSALSTQVASRLMHHLQHRQEALTPREAEILELLTDGLGNRELARRLFISETTVKTHLAHIYTKLGVDGRGAAIAAARQRGIVRPPEHR
ncbi:two component transcriptional regulator, LuxR family [Plantibacter sp. VKM Ac-1784]|uniref:Two component transcriptional regulator, LuxR family n=1 Tax=Plantibacter elymi (nom. nud.) TaxID=199708 RepID=A0ABY1RH51_9MICO|nr:response regulator transcription factor [Plantibacter sp. VKM Ac-1784]SMQ73928.1 two component transcriptional regulator, LuxR family [Plantibacter sp. VKM Ac-1784]